ncbi:MAG: hypothetical protein GX483_01965 [Actinomycetaceae bacterium]|nr:hypothetical protein [Actinomycetaceae bacterium]
MKIEARAIRDNPWWVAEFAIEGREYGTQARRLDLLEGMIRDAAALMTGRAKDSFDIRLTVEDEYVKQLVSAYQESARIAREAEAVAAASSRRAVRELRARNMSMRDIGKLMGISVQRVSQLAKA